MFVNCKHCRSLVATDPVTDQPPLHCPRCGGLLREETGSADAEAASTTVEDAIATAPEELADEEATVEPVHAATDATEAETGIDLQADPADTADEAAPSTDDAEASGTMPELATSAEPPANQSPTQPHDRTLVGWIGSLLRRRAQPLTVAQPVSPPTQDDAPASDHAPVDVGTVEAVEIIEPVSDAEAIDLAGATPPVTPVHVDDSGGVDAPGAAPQAEPAEPEHIEPRTADASVDAEPASESEVVAAVVHEDFVQSGNDTFVADNIGNDASDAVIAEEVPTAEARPTGIDTELAQGSHALPADTRPSAVAHKPAPSFARIGETSPTSNRSRWLATGVIALLATTLAVQILLADRAQLAADARWRPSVATLCNVFGCTLPVWREPDALKLLALDVRPHPSQPGVLRATATLRNDARWSQAWPELVLTLSDIDGRALGARAFDADEYLGSTATHDGLASGQSAMVAIDVLEPAGGAISYSLDIR